MNLSRYLGAFLIGLVLCACGHRYDTRNIYHPVGVQAAANFAGATVGSETLKKETRWMFGQNIELEFNDYLAYRQEVWYAQKGGRAEAGQTILGSTLGNTANYEVNYVEIDALLKVRFDYWGLKPFILGGPFIAISESKRVIGAGAPSIDERDLEFGVAFGAGFEIDLFRSVALILGGRYSMGLTNAINSNEEWRSRNVAVVLGLEFNLRPDRHKLKRARRYVGHYREFKDIAEQDLK